jgi:hypothetical protein
MHHYLPYTGSIHQAWGGALTGLTASVSQTPDVQSSACWQDFVCDFPGCDKKYTRNSSLRLAQLSLSSADGLLNLGPLVGSSVGSSPAIEVS